MMDGTPNNSTSFASIRSTGKDRSNRAFNFHQHQHGFNQKPSSSRRSESGTQLLARLSSRPSLTNIDPLIFRNPHQSKQKDKDKTDIVEVYGAEGVCKSLLCLHLAAEACLPSRYKELDIGGLAAKVILIDTDFKFSVLNFAVIVETQLLSLLEKCYSKINPEVGEANDNDRNKETDAVKSDKNSNVALTPSEVEVLLQESLSRVEVLRVTSSDQLLMTLHTLSNTALSEPDLSLIIIDSLSAFYWHDRTAHQDNPNTTEHIMRPIAEEILRLTKEFGLTFLVTKSALIGNRRRQFEDEGSHSSKDESQLEHVEFLGKTWLDLKPMRVTLTRKVNVNGKVEFFACSDSWDKHRKFCFHKDIIKFL